MAKVIGVTKLEGQLEIHHERGVIYFHSAIDGWTTLRISKLPPIPSVDEIQLDISHMNGTSWGPITAEEKKNKGDTGYDLEKQMIENLK